MGGGETPRLWGGGKLAISVCCDYVAFVLFFQIVTAPGSAVVNVSLSLLYGLLYHLLAGVSGLERVVRSCLVCRQYATPM